VVEILGGFRVQDATGQRLAYFYWWPEPTVADVLTEAEAQRLAEDFARLPKLLKKP
jgi:hypothetical protein